MSTFDQTIEHLVLYLEQVEGTLLLIAVCDDTVLREHAVQTLRQRLPPEIVLHDFRYDAEHLSLLEGAVAVTASGNGRPAVSATGLEVLSRDKRTEAIQLLNLQRNRFGRTNIAVLLWVTRALLADISTSAADFYSWRSATVFIEPPPDWNALDSARRGYLQALLTQNTFVSLQGLAPMRGGQIVQMRMEDIFIPLYAERDTDDVTGALQIDMVGDTVSVGDMVSVGIVPLPHRLPEPTPAPARYGRETRREARPRRVDTLELLQERRAVVLGDPGAGKSTLLRYAAYTLAQAHISAPQSEIITRIPDLADYLPVYVRIGEYAQHLQTSPTATLDAFAPIGCQGHQIPLTDELLQNAMAQGRALFLLDGLDEIIDTGQRHEVAQRIEQLARVHPHCRMLVTSRLVGYREAQLGKEFAQFTMRPFAETEIRRFAQNWYAALGLPASAEGLVQAIQDSPPIRRLASNPLLLTVIALIHWHGTKLPSHRVTLYRLAAETLVDQWMSHRRVSPEGWDVQETTRLLLPAIAWHLHHTTSSGLIDQEALHGLLVDTLRQQDPNLSKPEVHARATQFRRNVSEFSGIFLERGLDQNGRGIYGFLHLTFEEYFAALRLADKWQREGDGVLKPLLHAPRWNEIILLTAGHFGEFDQFQATRFVRTLLEAQSAYEDVLHRDLLLAARCLADDVRVDADVRRTIVSQLLNVYFAPASPPALQEDIRKVFARLGGTTVGAELSKALMQRSTNLTGKVRPAAAEALGQMGPGAATPEVLTALLALLRDADRMVRQAAARALGQMGPGAATPEVLTALLALLRDAEWMVRWAAAGALRNLSAHVRAQQRLETTKLFLRLTRSRDAEQRDTGYVCLRNLLAAESS